MCFPFPNGAHEAKLPVSKNCCRERLYRRSRQLLALYGWQKQGVYFYSWGSCAKLAASSSSLGM